MLQTTEQVKAGSEILIDYGAAFWDAWAKHRDDMDDAREEALAGLLAAEGALGRCRGIGYDARSFFSLSVVYLSPEPQDSHKALPRHKTPKTHKTSTSESSDCCEHLFGSVCV
jgi:hypothetical protein